MQYRVFETSWGYFGLVSLRGQLVSTWLPASKKQVERAIHNRWPSAKSESGLLEHFCRDVERYFEGQPVSFDKMKISLSGLTPFRQQILEGCRRVGYGETVFYGELASRCSAPGAARAVGSAMAVNPLPLVVPCHRIVRSDGKLGGFSALRGVSQKKRLLDLEADHSLRSARSISNYRYDRFTTIGA